MNRLPTAFLRWFCRACSLMVFVLFSVSLVAAQAASCPAYVEQALDTVGDTCGTMGRNQVCYGNSAISAEFDAAASVQFALPGDRASTFDLRRLTTAALQPERSVWGVAVLALQANLPDSLPGENATFIVFGDAELEQAETAPGYEAPMQAFNLSTRITGLDCEEVPESGLLVQAPQETTVNFLINGVEVSVGSSAMFQVEGEDLTVDTVEGFVQVTSGGASEVAGEGVSVRVRRGQRPLRASLSRSARLRNAPWRLLPRRVRVANAVPEGQLVSLNECFYPTPQRAAQNPIAVSAGENVVLRLRVAHQSLDIARIIQRQMQNELRLNGEPLPVYTRIGPWRGEGDEYSGGLGIAFYWLIEAPAVGDLRIVLDQQSLDGRPIRTGIDGPDEDSEPEVIPARRRFFCAVQAR